VNVLDEGVSHGIGETSFWFVELLLQFSDFVSVPVHNAHDLIGAFYGGVIPFVAESFVDIRSSEPLSGSPISGSLLKSLALGHSSKRALD